ncbi:MAG: hypothetical protein ACRCSF_13400 [Mycobacteriaceae bacterium]
MFSASESQSPMRLSSSAVGNRSQPISLFSKLISGRGAKEVLGLSIGLFLTVTVVPEHLRHTAPSFVTWWLLLGATTWSVTLAIYFLLAPPKLTLNASPRGAVSVEKKLLRDFHNPPEDCRRTFATTRLRFANGRNHRHSYHLPAMELVS